MSFSIVNFFKDDAFRQVVSDINGSG